MAEIVEARVPDIGGVEVTVTEILVKPGDTVTLDTSLVTVEGDKASMEIPAPVAGVVRELKVQVGAKVVQDVVFALIEVAASPGSKGAGSSGSSPAAAAPTPAPATTTAPAATPAPVAAPAAPAAAPAAPAAAPPAPVAPLPLADPAFDRAYAGPGVRKLARELGVPIGQVRGTGRKGRITPDDLKAWVKNALAQGAPAGAGISGFTWPTLPAIDFAKFGPVEKVPLGRIRKVSAANLHRSWLHVPLVTQHESADITEMEAFRKAHAEEAQKLGFKLTPVVFLLKAVVAALRKFPDFNASLDPSGESLIVKKYFHIGVAVDTPNGLVVPVLRDVDQKGLYALAKELGELSTKAREGKLAPQDYQGACFTISSLGGIGGTGFTPLVNAPEVAILGVSKAAMAPCWIDGQFVPRLMLPLSLSYDHRVIDGAQACRFIVELAGLLADLRKLLL